jgi:hypothetical protein
VDLAWSDEHSADPSVSGYGVYYDQGDKAQSVATLGQVTAYGDSGLTDGQTYCYKVTTLTSGCESGFSNILCATPEPSVQTAAGVDLLESGAWVTVGKGKDRQTNFSAQSVFAPGETVALRVRLVDAAGQPLAGAAAALAIGGPEAAAVTTGASGSDGVAYAEWATSAPNKRGAGGTATGVYTAQVTGVTGDGYVWDGVVQQTGFELR